MMLISIHFLCFQLKITHGLFNLYNTNEAGLLAMANVFDHDCLYVYDDLNIAPSKSTLIPYCMRPEISEKFMSNSHHTVCYGRVMTFKELKSMNISISDLFKWNAVIELIDLYEKYLFLPDLVNENESYCQCSSSSQFGRFCQYTIVDINFDVDDDEQSFSTLVHSLTAQNWRQICNGIVDCNRGEDEPFDLCLQLESNQCDIQTEFRYRNKDFYLNEDSSLNLCSFTLVDQFICLTNKSDCIRRKFIKDQQYDRLDGSDEYLTIENMDCVTKECIFHPEGKLEVPLLYYFDELCDNVVNRFLFPDQTNETAETDCEY
ncbi:unnamed protein product [Adineta ricciae]|uniref:Uncharacterized protein n=1 Tax=Adineta ricciae TaxID=249248 RepID=A0A814CMP6_ADIRI|nr:unnamed protein product [Adineta ricciae]CAF1156702.1 unnamed protein product [Adineta ricciae]